MSTINISSLLKILGLILLITAVSFLICIPVAVIYSEPVKPFLLAFATAILPGLLFYIPGHTAAEPKLASRDGYLSVTLGWATLVLSGTLPFVYSHEIKGFVNMLFESMSGFTTTGATILTDVESLSKSILFWRSLTHWIGGIGIILLVIIIFPSLKVGGYALFTLESSMKEKILPRTRSIARTVMVIYFVLTVMLASLLTAGGMSLFDSICHAFGTIATAGFSTHNDSIARYSPYIQYVLGFFMFLSAASFVVLYYLYKRNFTRIRNNEELWFYVIFTVAAVMIVTLILYTESEQSFEESFRHAFFQVTSTISTTGYATTDYMLWPHAAILMIFLLMFAGGCTGSTTGGIKMARHLIVFKNLRNAFLKLQHPNAVIPIRLNGHSVPDSINSLMLLFIFLYIIIFIIGLLIMLLSGISYLEAVGASAGALSCVGPGLGAAGNMGNFAHFNDVGKMTMVLLMIIGRLELFTFIALFTRSFWKR